MGHARHRRPQPAPAAWSETLARVSRPWLLRLSALPRVVLMLGTVGLLGAGVFVPGIVGALCLLLIGLFLLWLALLAWPALAPGPRLLRVGVSLVVLGFAVAKAVGAV